MEQRIDLFEHGGKKFIYYDVSHFKNNAQFKEFIEYAKTVIQRYARQDSQRDLRQDLQRDLRQSPAEGSIFSITNIEGVIYDTETKIIVAEWMDFNRPYIKLGAVIGLDGIKRIMVNSILKMSGRNNMKFFRTRDEAVQWLAAR